MTTKQPATPLPWYRNGSSHVYNTARSAIDGVGGEWPVCYATFTEPKDGAPQNAAYIVHAANAYPELVAALRDLNSHASHAENQIAGLNIPGASEYFDEMRASQQHAEALLAKLGE